MGLLMAGASSTGLSTFNVWSSHEHNWNEFLIGKAVSYVTLACGAAQGHFAAKHAEAVAAAAYRDSFAGHWQGWLEWFHVASAQSVAQQAALYGLVTRNMGLKTQGVFQH